MAYEENMRILSGAFNFPPAAPPAPVTPRGATKGGGSKPSTSPPKTPPKNPNLLKDLGDQWGTAFNSYDASLRKSQETNYTGAKVKVMGGKDKGVQVPVELLKDIITSAKRNGYDPYMALAQVSQESSFGTDTGQYTAYDPSGQRLPSQSRTAIVQGLNLDEPYRPMGVEQFMYNQGVPGIKAKPDRVEGQTYHVEDEQKAVQFLNEHPEIVQKYKAHLKARSSIPETYNAYDAAWKRDKRGLNTYNADPRYAVNIKKYAKQLASQKEIADLVASTN